MYFVLLGWQRPVRDRNADRIVRLRPSLPTARSESRISDSALRSSRIGDTFGCALAISRKVSSSSLSCPVSVVGQGMPFAASQRRQRSRRKLRPSNTP